MKSFALAFRRVCILGVSAALVTAVAASPARSEPEADGLRLVSTQESLLGTHYWYEQTFGGHPVVGGFYARHVDRASGAVTVDDGRKAVRGPVHGLAGGSVTQTRANAAAAQHTGGDAYRSRLVIVPGDAAKLAWQVHTDPETGSVESLVDADNATILSTRNLVKHAVGKVFDPNPPVAEQNTHLVDTSPASAFTYETVLLTHQHSQDRLIGAYANNVSKKPVTSSLGYFAYDRSQAGFEQVMGYYHITSAQEYIHRLGFSGVNSESQDYRTTGLTDDNSFYDPAKDLITFGTGGVDDAEDAEIIWHEYGHAIQDAQVPDFGTSPDGGAIGEGFGDYWAYTMSQPVSPNTETTPWACIGDWDATSYATTFPRCLRRTDGRKVYPRDLTGEVHDDGEIWSRALQDINTALGRATADRIIIESHFTITPTTTMPAAASRTIAAARALCGTAAANAVKAAFHARGLA
ncbi:bacillolysin [Longispora fulva]|uniref:Zn-dependent metalloprotease n=1 Tax=Longispora fulva TaxID=619741 RepID=A0A8J7GDD2_9ACTN|nr:bacillolysin [Longispora fulva]MBG6135950.1 Zn-dependent metalloprotease [Longispora fulva]GIG55806.1 bacillolysin [Longispora fulva]